MAVPGSKQKNGVARARKIARNAYAPYSAFHVGVVAVTDDGKDFAGVNMENASYGVGICGEVSALAAAATAGRLGDITTLYVTGGTLASDVLTGEQVVTPCGRCRQLIYEASLLGGRDIDVICSSGDGNHVRAYTASELLPDGFGPTALNQTK